MEIKVHLKLLSLVVFSFIVNIYAEESTPEKIYSIRKAMYPAEWYIEQSKVWQQEVEKNPKNSEAWLNYYRATRYATQFSPKEERGDRDICDKIVQDMEKHILKSFEYYYVKYYHHNDPEHIEYLEKAYELQPENPLTYYDFIAQYERMREKEKMAFFCRKLYESQDIISSLLDYNYNVLISTNENAILFTNGDNDTYPLWLLQKVKGIRTDVMVVNLSLAHDIKYLKKLMEEQDINIKKVNPKEFDVGILINEIQEQAPDRPIYFAVTVAPYYRENLEDNLYLTGIVFQYSKERFDNIAVMKNNFENRYRLDYLTYDWYNESNISYNMMLQKMNLNYIAGTIQLYKHYRLSGDLAKADYWWNLGFIIADNADNEQGMKYLNEIK